MNEPCQCGHGHDDHFGEFTFPTVSSAKWVRGNCMKCTCHVFRAGAAPPTPKRNIVAEVASLYEHLERIETTIKDYRLDFLHWRDRLAILERTCVKMGPLPSYEKTVYFVEHQPHAGIVSSCRCGRQAEFRCTSDPIFGIEMAAAEWQAAVSRPNEHVDPESAKLWDLAYKNKINP